MSNTKIIYVYSMPNDISKIGQVKVGDTLERRGIDARLKEQSNATAAEIKLHFTTKAVTKDGTSFRDYDVHRELKKMGIERVSDKHEWFRCSPEDVKEAIKNITKFNDVNKVITLRPHQKLTLKQMIDADTKNYLLNLAPRFGKTYLILEFAKEISKKYDNVYLVVASKNLSSNASFTSSYNNSGYNFRLLESSLFKTDDSISNNLDEIPKDSNIILVTDEADLASHTKKSLAKLEKIKSTLNIIKQISMSGTGIYKADKLIKNETDVTKIYVNYTDLLANSDNIVRRNFLNVKIDMKIDSELLNIQQSFSDSRTYNKLINYVDSLLNTNINIGLKEDSNTSMIFINTETNKNLQDFTKEYKLQHPEKYVITLTGSSEDKFRHNNKIAENNVKHYIRKNKRNGTNKKIVIFSRQMSSRSFSIPEIDTVILFKDGLLSNSDYQKLSRGLTQNSSNTKISSNIIRVSCTDISIDKDIFLLENTHITKHSPEFIVGKAKRFFKYNDFSSCTFEDGSLISTNKVTDSYSFVDELMKFTDDSKYILGRIVGLNVEVSNILSSKSSKQVTKSDATKTKPKKDKSSSTVSQTSQPTEDIAQLEKYSEILVTLPAVSNVFFGVKDVNLLHTVPESLWDDYLIIDKDTFLRNLNIPEFKFQIESLFRLYKDDDEYNHQKLYDLMSLSI